MYQNFNIISHEEPSLEFASPSQDENRKKRKITNEEMTQNSEDVEEPKGKILRKLTEEDDILRCSICTELFIKAVTLRCSHTFCKYCIDLWRRNCTNAKCPICRAKIDSLSPTWIIDNLIIKIIDNCSDEAKERRIKIIEERTSKSAAYANSVGENEELDYGMEEEDNHEPYNYILIILVILITVAGNNFIESLK